MKEDVYFILDEIDKKKQVEENQLLYLPPKMETGFEVSHQGK